MGLVGWIVTLLVASAWAQEPEQADVDLPVVRALLESYEDVDVRSDIAGLKADGFVLEDSVMRATFEEGVLVPIFAGLSPEEWEKRDARGSPPKDPDERAKWEHHRAHRAPPELVGAVFVGKGTVEWILNEKSDRMRYANHRARVMGDNPERLAPFVKGLAPEKANITRGLIVTGDPAVLARLDALTPVGEGTVVVGNEDVEIVPDLNWSKTVSTARQTWKERDEGLALKRDVWQGLLRQVLQEPGWVPPLYMDFHTDRRYGAVIEGSWAASRPEDQWIGMFRDDSGLGDTRLRTQVFSYGKNLKGRTTGAVFGGETFPTMDEANPLSPPFPAIRPEPVFAEADVRAEVSKDGFYMDVAADVKFSVRASGGPLRTFKVYVDKANADRFRNKWRFDGITLEDGTPVTLADPEDEKFHELAGELTVVLPEPLEAGEEIALKTSWSGTWPYGNATELGSLGLSTGLQDVLPGLSPGLAGSPWRFRIRVRVPETSDLSISLSGATTAEGVENGWRFVEASREDQDAMWPNVAIGRWANLEEPAQGDFPAIKLHMFAKHANEMKTFPAEMRRVISYYQEFLPPFPFEEIELFQAPSGFYGFVWIAPHAMVNLQATMVFSETGGGASLFRNDTPHLEAGVLAHELAHMYWGHVQRPASTRDFWMAETFAETYACMYMAAAYGADAYDKRFDSKREIWEKRLTGPENTASLTDAYSSRYQPQIVYQYGPLVFNEMLRKRIGDEAFYGALDVILRDHHETLLTTEALQTYFEKASGRDLGPFFDYWVRGGFVPEKVEVVWKEEGHKVQGTVTTDVPFGTMDLPIRVWTSKKHFQDVWVDVVNGAGTFEAEVEGSVRDVKPDPDGLILARKRLSSRAK